MWAISVLGMVLLGCSEHEFYHEKPSIGYAYDSTLILSPGESTTISLRFTEPARQNGEVILKVEGSAIYNSHYTTIPALEAGEMTLNISKGDSLVSFKVISLEEGPHDANTWINFLIKGISEEFEIGEAQSHTVQLQQIDQETEVVINFSETFVHISENEPNPFEIRMDITGSINHSDRVIIRIQAPDNIT